MTKEREALKLALKALEAAEIDGNCEYGVTEIIREALAQPVQEPVSMRMPKVGDKVICIEDESLGEVVSLTAGGSPDIKFADGSHGTYLLREFAELFGYVTPPLPVQEPVAYCYVQKGTSVDILTFDDAPDDAVDGTIFPLYTTPPKREWVGLTDEQMMEITNKANTHPETMQMTQAKLKELNHG